MEGGAGSLGPGGNEGPLGRLSLAAVGPRDRNPPNPGVVAFDMDMTLVDSRPVSRRVLERLVAEHGYDLDVELLMERYGLPMSSWLPEGCDHELFQALQLQDVTSAEPMPGALEAVAAARALGNRVIVVTAAPRPVVLEILRELDLVVDRVWAGVWAAEKAGPLREAGSWAFVGDHADDMSAAHEAGAVAVGVATGTSRPSGADVVLDDLTAFASWLADSSPRLVA